MPETVTTKPKTHPITGVSKELLDLAFLSVEPEDIKIPGKLPQPGQLELIAAAMRFLISGKLKSAPEVVRREYLQNQAGWNEVVEDRSVIRRRDAIRHNSVEY